MQPFTSKVIHIIKAIPPGKVMTYSQIAACAGSSRAARQVVRILHSMSEKHGLPWHRVVNIRGEISLADTGATQQQNMLEDEGIEFVKDRTVDLSIYQYKVDAMDFEFNSEFF
ncbi:MGMT family protein [Paenibacillus pinihumi]|uniref:MGMT family protein n=1 Tax=Paenibacillus pinihumi TaxID=669462 RepID=UPI00040315DA|nr:MGMT family protein [Paenibacillus pinihumi]